MIDLFDAVSLRYYAKPCLIVFGFRHELDINIIGNE